MSSIEMIALDACESTQDEVRAQLADAAPGTAIAVRAREQVAGRGREGRGWQNPPGTALLMSIGMRGPLPVRVLQELPLRVAGVVLDVLEQLAPGARGVISWKAPNDLVAAVDGAKVAGILVDARTTGDAVEQLIVGIGLNLDGAAFQTGDGRTATSVAQLTGHAPGVERTGDIVAAGVLRLLTVTP